MAATQEGRIPVVLVGSGRIGVVHLHNILANQRFHLKYVVDADEKAAHNAAAKSPSAKPLTTIDEALNDKEVKGVVICTPTAAHREIILKSLRAGKAVMCEKPISLNINEIDECYNEAKKCGVPLLCGYQRRHDPSFRQLQEACKKGAVGTVQIVKTTSRDNPVPTLAYLKISGRIFHDCGSHDIDVCRWILGEDPVEVFTVASAFKKEIKEMNDWDTVLISLRYPSGAIASIDLSRKAAYGYDQRIEVLGDKGMVQSMNRQPTTTIVSTDQGILSDPYCYSFPQRYEHAYALELDHFADIITKGVTPLLSHDDARKVAIIADAAEKSAETGLPVKLSYD
jgi:myo-inositol 2-dehydrogenase/D-chiro-inositol 1-dehydrogenase